MILNSLIRLVYWVSLKEERRRISIACTGLKKMICTEHTRLILAVYIKIVPLRSNFHAYIESGGRIPA